MSLDLRQVMGIARRRWWIIVLVIVMGGGAGYAVAALQTPMYQAVATVMVSPGGAAGASGADYSSLLASERLADTYTQVITENAMQDRVASALGVGELEPGVVTASVIGNTHLIKVVAEDPDAERAAFIANTVVEEFEQYVAEQASERADSARSRLDAQISALDARIDTIDTRVAELEGADGAASGVAQRSSTISRRNGQW